MSSKNSQKHFTVGIGVYTPWRSQSFHVREALTKQSPARKFKYAVGMKWQDGKLVAMKPLPDNRRVRKLRGRALVKP
jgi:hypothetical protein